MDDFKNEKKPDSEKTFLQVLIGLLTPAITFIIIAVIMNYLPPVAVILTAFVLITFSVLLGIGLIKKNFKIAGILILVISAPVLVLGLAFGACVLVLSDGKF